jgi:CheY-like chemotaxis protein
MAGHNLAIQVYSEGVNGKGTQFYIDVPLMPSLSGDADGSDHANGTDNGIAHNEPKRGCLSCCKKTPSIQDVELASNSPTQLPNRDNDVLSSGKAMPKSSRHAISSRRAALPLKLDEMRILIVDDSVLNRKMLTRTLKQHGIGASFEDASDGLELLALFGVPESDDASDDVIDFNAKDRVTPLPELENAATYDVILLDDNMIQMNGSVAIKKLRQHGYEGLIVGVTGSALEEDMNAFCAAGVDYALPKPFVVEDFIDIVESHF